MYVLMNLSWKHQYDLLFGLIQVWMVFRNKIEPSKFCRSNKQFHELGRQHPNLASKGGGSLKLYKMEDFYRMEGEARKLLEKEKDCSRLGTFP